MEDKKAHWENIYENKKLTEVSWYQPKPSTSLKLIAEFDLDKNAEIIDVGGGDSFLADHLLADGYINITVLDISGAAIERARKRLKDKAEMVNWICADASNFKPSKVYDLWHDRAAFHFINEKDQISAYLKTMESAVKPGGYVIIGTFSEKGPSQCSGIYIRQYSMQDMISIFPKEFRNITCKNVDHNSPSGAVQNFTFCTFKKLNQIV